MLSERLAIELSDCEAENGTLKGNHLRHVVEIVIRGDPTVLDVHCMCLFMSLGRILLQGSISTIPFDPMTLPVVPQKEEVRIQLVENIYLVADIIPPGVHFAPPL